ncbi:MAG TPA: glycosyltransferase family 87 protein [Gemmatimonadaceae bacterium]|nr:glycosyltransferase family 87 protein [Gemmatimonadaceae bacterium]
MNRVMLALWIIAAIGASVSPVLKHSNNFEIFRSAWSRFAAGQDLYAASGTYFDLFKYTPSAALVFFPFAVLPFALGLLLWNGVNAATLYWSLGRLLAPREATIVRAIVLPEMFGSLQSAQSNALVAALIILTFTELERRHDLRAAIAVCIGTVIKIFPLAAVSFALLRPERRRFAMWCAIVGVTLLIAPMLIRGPSWLFHQYDDWLVVQRVDSGDPGFSVMALVRLGFGVDWPLWPQQLAGVVALLGPLVLINERLAVSEWRLRYAASLLIFCVIFNHQSEGPSFVIAMAGVGIWFVLARRSWQCWLALAFVLVFTVLASSTLVPRPIRAELFHLRFKTVPVVVVWIILQIELWKRPVIPARRWHSEQATT